MIMKRRDFDLLALGEILLRLSPPVNERLTRGDVFQKQAGGAELNVVSGVSLLGLRTGIISKIPANDLGNFIQNRVRFCGVSDDYLVYDKTKDSRLGIYYYEYGAHPRKPNVIYDRKNTAFSEVSIDDFPEEMYRSTRCFFKENGTLISFDVNFRANLWTGQEAKECIEQILPYVDVFFCSEDTARLTFGKEGTVQDMMRSFTKDYPISVVAATQRVVHSPKIHSFGSCIYDAIADRFVQEPAYENIDVVDRIGSGDAYISGALYGLLAHNMDCQKAMEYGNATAAVKNTIPGDLPSSNLREIDSIIANHHSTGPQLEMNR